MNYGNYIAFIVGMTAGILAVGFGLHVRSKTRGADPIMDERTALINMRGGQWAFYIITVVAFVVWVVDNVKLGQQGEVVEFFSPWGVMFFTCIVIFGLTRGYSHYLSSQSLLDGDSKHYRTMGLVLFLGGIGTSRATELLHPFFHYVSLIALIGACFFLLLSAWLYRKEKGEALGIRR